jgi:inorganic pyrophosphatase
LSSRQRGAFPRPGDLQPAVAAREGKFMDVKKIAPGRNPPTDLHAIIEIPVGGVPVKYELDKESGALFVDRFLHTSMYYPANYGFIPQTLSEDGDPCDVLVVGTMPVVPGAVIRCRPVGAIIMEDEAGIDEKLLAVAVDDLQPFYSDVREHTDLPPLLLDQIIHFFTHYKDLEKGKWVKLARIVGAQEAGELVMAAIARAAEKAA